MSTIGILYGLFTVSMEPELRISWSVSLFFLDSQKLRSKLNVGVWVNVSHSILLTLSGVPVPQRTGENGGWFGSPTIGKEVGGENKPVDVRGSGTTPLNGGVEQGLSLKLDKTCLPFY